MMLVTPLPALLLIAVVAALALVLRGMGRRDETVPVPRTSPERPGPDDADDLDDDTGPDEEGLVEAAAVTSDGWAFVPRGQGLELVPPGVEEEQVESEGSDAAKHALETAPVNPQTGKRLVFWRPGEHLAGGDLIAARVVRGAPSVDPWRLEALGRDYDYRAYAFETQEAALTALELVQTRIVRLPRDEHGDPIPVGAEDFAVARRQHEETEQALAMEPEDDPESPR